MEDVNERRRNFLSLSKLECGPQEINSREFCLHLTFSANWKTVEETRQSLKKRQFILKVTFSLPSLSSMLKLPNLYPVDSAIGFPYTYLLDSDLSDG